MTLIFILMGTVITQNCRIWDSENPDEVLQERIQPLVVIVWCGLRSGDIIGSYFFENEDGAPITDCQFG